MRIRKYVCTKKCAYENLNDEIMRYEIMRDENMRNEKTRDENLHTKKARRKNAGRKNSRLPHEAAVAKTTPLIFEIRAFRPVVVVSLCDVCAISRVVLDGK